MGGNIEQGAVVVDIGDGYGALVVTMPASLLGEEVELVPTGTRPVHEHEHGHTHEHGPDDPHPHGHANGLDPAHPPHVAVVNRRAPDGRVFPSLVFGTLLAGTYDLYVRPTGPVRLTVEIRDSEVTQTDWPSGE